MANVPRGAQNFFHVRRTSISIHLRTRVAVIETEEREIDCFGGASVFIKMFWTRSCSTRRLPRCLSSCIRSEDSLPTSLELCGQCFVVKYHDQPDECWTVQRLLIASVVRCFRYQSCWEPGLLRTREISIFWWKNERERERENKEKWEKEDKRGSKENTEEKCDNNSIRLIAFFDLSIARRGFHTNDYKICISINWFEVAW